MIETIPRLRMDVERAPEKEGEQDAEAVRAYDRTSGWPPFSLLRYMVIRRLEKNPPQGALLDAGCGPGHLAIAIAGRFPQAKVSGVDNNNDMIAAALRNRARFPAGNVDFRLGDVHLLPCEDGSFDLVVSTLSLHHWRNAGRALGEIFRVLKPGGRLLLMDLRRDGSRCFYYLLILMQRFAVPASIRRINGPVGSFYASYTIAEVKRLLDSIPFQNAEVEPAFGWMFARAQKAPPAE
jgi:ubiquinone/menaquinone biosynthesis C-methylase UbiE